MIREVFVPMLESDADQTAITVAAQVAEAQLAHVSVLVTLATPFPMVTEMGYVPVEVCQQQVEEARATANRIVASAREQLTHSTASSETRLSDALLWSEETAAMHARHADISVIGRPDPPLPSPRFGLTFNSLLMRSGRPLLVVSPGASLSFPLKRVVIAWKPTPEASRAVHDALPLLGPGTEVDVVMIDPVPADAQHGPEPGSDIAHHLARHGLKVQVLSLASQGRSDGENLLRHAAAVGAGLLVMGGYGHARWRESVLGGATRHVLDHAHVPVLFSH